MAARMHVEVAPVGMSLIPLPIGMSAVIGGVSVHPVFGDLTAAELVDSRKLELEFDLVDPDLLITDRAGSAAAMTAPRADWGAVRELASFDGLADPLP